MEGSVLVEVPRTTHILVLKMAAFGLHLMMFCLGLASVWGNELREKMPRNIPNVTKTFELGAEKIQVNVTMAFKCFRCGRPRLYGDTTGDEKMTQIVGFTFCIVASMLFALGSLTHLLCEKGLGYFFVRKCDRVILIICGIWMLLNCFFLTYAPFKNCSNIESIESDAAYKCRRSWRYSEVVVSTLFGIASASLYFAAAICACLLKEPDWMVMADQGIPPEEAHKYRLVPDSEASMRSQTAPGPSQPSQTQTSVPSPPLPAEP